MAARDSEVVSGESEGFLADAEQTSLGAAASHTQTNKPANPDVPEAAVRTQTRDSWQCPLGPRPKLGPADRRQTRLCLKHTDPRVNTRRNTFIQEDVKKYQLCFYN